MPQNSPPQAVWLDEDQFTLSGYNSGSEGIVATVTVPRSQVWQVPTGMPISVLLTHKQTVNIGSTTTQNVALAPDAPVVDYLPDPTAGVYSEDGYLVAYADHDDDGTKSLVTGSTGIQFTGTWTESGDFLTEAEINNTTATAQDVDIYTVARYGYARLQKRNSGKSNVSAELQTEDALSFAFSNPDDPEADRQLTWDSRNQGTRGVIPPKFNLDVIFYDDSEPVVVDEANATNMEISLPVGQRPVRSNEDPDSLRARVTASMAR